MALLSQTPAAVTLQFSRLDDFEAVFDVVDADDVALTLPSSCFTAGIYPSAESTSVIASFACVGGTGIVTVSIGRAAVAALPKRQLWWRLVIDDGYRSQAAAGPVNITP